MEMTGNQLSIVKPFVLKLCILPSHLKCSRFKIRFEIVLIMPLITLNLTMEYNNITYFWALTNCNN